MTLIASLGKASRHVVRICGSLIILQVAGDTSRTRQVVVVVQVAVGALPRRHRVPSRQGKSDGRMIKVRTQPAIRGVTAFAGSREFARRVVGIGGSREIRHVAGIASSGHRLELAVGRALVAGIAVHSGVRSGQREPVVMLLDLLARNLPAADRVALFAIGSQLPPVNIRVAVLASLSDVGEHRLDVTLDAGDGLVHAAQRVSRLVVVKFRNRADGFPPGRRVTVLTRDVQVAMRTVRSSGGLRLRASRHSGKCQQQHCK